MATIPWGNQFTVGVGLDSLTQETYGTAIEFDPPVSEQPGQTTSFYLETVTSSRDLAQTLNISAAASLDLGIFSGSAEFSLVRSTDINSFYTYALVRVSVMNPPMIIRNPRLTQQARSMLEQQGWNAFAAAYSWEYIAGIITGGTFYGLIEIQTTNSSEQQQIKTSLSASYGPFGGNAALEVTFREIATRFALNVQVFRAGGGGAVTMTWDAMLQEALQFPITIQNQPVSIQALVNDYRSSIPLPVIPPPDTLPVLQQRLSLEDLGKEYLRLRDYKRSLEFILSRTFDEFDEFRDLDQAELNQKRIEFQESLQLTANELDLITQQARRCYADINQCTTFVSTVRPLPLPQIGGDLMTIRQIEEQLANLTTTLVPVGTIIPFYGEIGQANNLQGDGWWICDGRTITDPSSPRTGQPTPDLRDRFLMGTGQQVGAMGGATTAAVPAQEVVVVAENFDAAQSGIPAIGPRVNSAWGDYHPIRSRGTVPGTTVSTLPPYMAVIYLMKAK
jgi:hypothetical protein